MFSFIFQKKARYVVIWSQLNNENIVINNKKKFNSYFKAKRFFNHLKLKGRYFNDPFINVIK